MRISDWSSDVCSSDLLEARYYALALWQFMPHFLRFVTLAALTFLLTRYISLEQVAFTYAGASLVVVGVGILYLWQMYHAHFNLSGHEIGRASCRERVCPYV